MKACKCENVAVEIAFQGVARIVCPIHGSYYMFRSAGGAWETQEEKQERLKFVRVCELCAEEYQIHQHENPGASLCGKFCPGCLKGMGTRKLYKQRDNPNSPWRTPRNVTRPMRYGVCKCGRPFETRSTNKYQCDPCQDSANRECVKMSHRAARA